jgi:endonuclease YncB( thermonuclease family)
MKKKTLFIVGLSLLMVFPLTSCGPKASDGEACSPLTNVTDPLSTPLTDALTLSDSMLADYQTKDFTQPESGLAYGAATLVKCTDGDTVNFKAVGGTVSFPVRFLGINTPESTAKVEPWGVKASHFTETTLTGAYRICLVNDIDAYTKYDSSGGRNLGFVWYQKTADSAWRLLNLEIVEQCYSKNQLFSDSSTLKYLSSFVSAGARGEKCGYRVYGAKDPDYDYNNDVVEATLYTIRNNYADLGIDTDTGTSGKQLRVKALLVAQIGDNMVLRDLVRDLSQKPTDPYTCIYAYAGYNTALASKTSIGDVVYFYCRATKYPKDSDNIQLSDVKTSTYGGQKFQVLAHMGDANWSTYVSADNGIDPVALPSTSVTTKDVLSTYSGVYVETQVTVRNVTGGEYGDDGTWISSGISSYYNEGKSGCTVYAYVKGTTIPCNLRIDNSSYPLLRYTDFSVGTSYNIKAYLIPYYTNFQLTLFNNTEEGNYVTPLA